MTGFTKIDNSILEKILTSDLTKRQLKILFMLVRFSFGCQKDYAVLKNNDFTYSGVSPFCIKKELKKLTDRRVIRWNPGTEIIWINKSLNEWGVDKHDDSAEKFSKLATKNLPKQQLRVYQNSNFRTAKMAISSNSNPEQDKGKIIPKENKEILNKKKEKAFLKILKDYFLKIAPLREEEICIMRGFFEKYNYWVFEKSIGIVSNSDNRSFPYFLKVVDDLAEDHSFRSGGLESLKSGLKRFLERTPKP